MASLIDTNVLVYRFDPRFPDKQQAATDLLRKGIAEDTVRLPHQAIIEFVAVVTRQLDNGKPLLPPSLDYFGRTVHVLILLEDQIGISRRLV